MKTKTFWMAACGVVSLAALPLMRGGGQELTNSAPAPVPAVAATTNPVISSDMAAVTNAATPEEAEQKLEDAPGRVVSSPNAVPSNVKLSAPAAEIVKLAQAGVDESVMLTFVTNSPNVFNLSSDDIIYLNDIGVPGTVVTAMLQRDQTTGTATTATAAATTSAPPVSTGQGAPTPYPTTETTSTEPPPGQVVETVPAPAANVSYTYFNDSLSPYGSWIDIAGYGRCWQPTVVVSNPGWQPYCDRGRWVYSDCGWYWASDYSWGWAPFHYGRWFRHNRWGWCWAPDTVWGPSWVSWRYTSDYCGWAPLPPTACFTPGFGFSYCGRSVGVGFSFGLSARHYAFVPTRNFCDRQPYRHRLSAHHVDRVFHNTTPANRIVQSGRNRIINHGIPVHEVSAATRREIRPVRIDTTDNPERFRTERGGRESGRTLTAFRPNMPQPERRTTLVGEGVQPAPRRFERASEANNNGTPRRLTLSNPNNPNPGNNSTPAVTPQTPGVANRGEVNNPRERREMPRRNESRPTETAQQSGNAPETATPGTASPGAPRNRSLILRGGNRPAPSNNEQETAAANSNPVRNQNQNNGSRSRILTPSVGSQTPSTPDLVQPTPPAQNNPTPAQNRRHVMPQRQQTPIVTPVPENRPTMPVPSQVHRSSERPVSQEAGRQRPQSERSVVNRMTTPVERQQPATPNFQTPRIVQPQSGYNPPAQRPSPSFSPPVMTPAPQSQPRQTPSFQSAPARQAPAIQSAPARQQSAPAPSSSRSSHQDRSDNNNNKRSDNGRGRGMN